MKDTEPGLSSRLESGDPFFYVAVVSPSQFERVMAVVAEKQLWLQLSQGSRGNMRLVCTTTEGMEPLLITGVEWHPLALYRCVSNVEIFEPGQGWEEWAEAPWDSLVVARSWKRALQIVRAWAWEEPDTQTERFRTICTEVIPPFGTSASPINPEELSRYLDSMFPPAPSGLTVEYLLELAEESILDLDEAVHDVLSEKASGINNSCLRSQIEFLLAEGWSLEEIAQRLKEE